jgi:hypothetical protein
MYEDTSVRSFLAKHRSKLTTVHLKKYTAHQWSWTKILQLFSQFPRLRASLMSVVDCEAQHVVMSSDDDFVCERDRLTMGN